MVNARGPADVLGLTGSTVDQVRFDACVDSGGFGLIYRGYHLGLGEDVAIKCLRIAGMQKADESVREAIAGRFRDETKLLYRLSQGNLDIVRCISSGTVVAPTTREITPYMVLEWLEGCTLSAELRERKAQGMGARTLEATVQLLDGAVSGIAYAHTHEVVHRDIKPGNLFITKTREGVRVKVLDFGLAKILNDEAIGVRPSVETGIGVHFCSPSYGAPEQFSTQLGKIGPWTDVYSLALVLLEVMVGDKVRQASTLAEGLVKAMDPKLGSPRPSNLGLKLPPAVEELFVRAVAQNPLERPRDAGVFWTALKDALVAAPRAAPVGAATVMDSSMADAMNEVRAAAVRASQRPPPFAGTMLMQNAPSGAPHMASPRPAAGMPPPGAQPQPPPPAQGGQPLKPGQETTQPPNTLPMLPPQPAEPAVGKTAAMPAHAVARPPPNRMALTVPLGAVSPLALPGGLAPGSVAPQGAPGSVAPQGAPGSVAPQGAPGSMVPPMSAQSPLASSMLHSGGAPSSVAPPSPGAGLQRGGSIPPPNAGFVALPPGRPSARTEPRANFSQMSQGSQSQAQTRDSQVEIPMKRSGGLVVIVILLFLAAAGGIGFWFFRRH